MRRPRESRRSAEEEPFGLVSDESSRHLDARLDPNEVRRGFRFLILLSVSPLHLPLSFTS
jgi:hypothetical protein